MRPRVEVSADDLAVELDVLVDTELGRGVLDVLLDRWTVGQRRRLAPGPEGESGTCTGRSLSGCPGSGTDPRCRPSRCGLWDRGSSCPGIRSAGGSRRRCPRARRRSRRRRSPGAWVRDRWWGCGPRRHPLSRSRTTRRRVAAMATASMRGNGRGAAGFNSMDRCRKVPVPWQYN